MSSPFTVGIKACKHSGVEEHEGEMYCTYCGLLVEVPSTEVWETSGLEGPDQSDRSAYLTETVGRQRVDRRGHLDSKSLVPRIRGRALTHFKVQPSGPVRRGYRTDKSLRHLAQILGIGPGRMRDRARYLVEKMQQAQPRSPTRLPLVAAAVYAASRESHWSLSLRRIALAAGCSMGAVGRTYLQFRELLALPVSLVDPILFLQEQLRQILGVLEKDPAMDLPAHILLPATESTILEHSTLLITYSQDRGLLEGRNPELWARASLLFSLELSLGPTGSPAQVTQLTKAVITTHGVYKRTMELRKELRDIAQDFGLSPTRRILHTHLFFLFEKCRVRLEAKGYWVKGSEVKRTFRPKRPSGPPIVLSGSSEKDPVPEGGVHGNQKKVCAEVTSKLAHPLPSRAPPSSSPSSFSAEAMTRAAMGGLNHLICPPRTQGQDRIKTSMYDWRMGLIRLNRPVPPSAPGVTLCTSPEVRMKRGPPAYETSEAHRAKRIKLLERARSGEEGDERVGLIRSLLESGTSEEMLLTCPWVRIVEEREIQRRRRAVDPEELNSRTADLTDRDLDPEELAWMVVPGGKDGSRAQEER
ncbi:MAG: hypothetical protein DHS80DRAFT_32567 [Piptocephalis tieghemiana]|nr:MAG: hypothetical protein DHS80DRAFT_32567 [Piptocephalis tieghemiana]